MESHRELVLLEPATEGGSSKTALAFLKASLHTSWSRSIDTVEPSILERELETFRTIYPARELTSGATVWRYRLTPATGPVALMLHGGGGSADSLFRYAATLSPHLQLLLPSLPASVATVDEALAGIRAVIAHSGTTPSNYVGFSMGGMLEQVMLREDPHGIRSLTLFHCPPPGAAFADALERRSVLMHLLPALLAPLVRLRVQRELAASGLDGDELTFWADYYSSPEVLARTRGHQAIVLDYLRNCSFAPDQLDGWGGRVQIFETATDKVIPGTERARLRQLYPNATVTTFENGGHLGNGITRWREVSDRIAAICRHPSGANIATTR